MWSMPVTRNDVPERGRHIALSPNAAEMAGIAGALDLIAVKDFDASVDILPWKADGLVITGRFKAVVVRTCVISLEDFDQTISAEFERRCHPVPEEAKGPDFDPLADDPPDLLEPDGVDICALVLEEFALAIDPHPRKPGEEFLADSAPGSGDAAAAENPFSVLKKLALDTDN